MLKGIRLGTTVTGTKAKAEAVVEKRSATKTSAIVYKFNEGFNNVIYRFLELHMATKTLKKGPLLFFLFLSICIFYI